LNGDEIKFNAGSVEYTGHVTATGMQGKTSAGAAWSATR
jgi:hypothetical protein